MKVLHVESGMHLYGGARQVLYLLEGLATAASVESVLVVRRGSAIAQEAARAASACRRCRSRGDLDPLLWWRLLRVIRARAAGHRPPAQPPRRRRAGRDRRAAGRRADGAVAPRRSSAGTAVLPRWRYALVRSRHRDLGGDPARAAAAGVDESKVVCVPSAVDLRAVEPPVSHDALCASCALHARLDRHRRRRAAHRAQGTRATCCARCRHRWRPCRTRGSCCFGRGPLADALRAEPRALNGSSTRSCWRAFARTSRGCIGALDLVVHPATAEGSGVAVLEAAAAARPIVASAAGGVPEIVRDGETGLPRPLRDVDALGTAVSGCCRIRRSRGGLGEAARAPGRGAAFRAGHGRRAISPLYRGMLGQRPDPDRA